MTANEKPIAFIGAGGRTGQGILGKLVADGLNIRLLSRFPKHTPLLADVDTRHADLTNALELANALSGCHQIYYIPPALDPREEEYARNLLAAMRAVNISRVTYHSVLHAATPTLPHHARKSRVEHIFRSSESTWTILQPAMYTQSMWGFFDAEKGLLAPAFDVKSRFTQLDLADLAEAVSAVLQQSGHEFATYELAGSENLSFEEMASQMSAELGRDIRAVQADRQRVLENVSRVNGFTGEALREFDCMLEHYDAHGLVGNGNVLSWLLGRQALTFHDMLQRTFA